MLGNITMFDAIMAYCVICAVRDIGCFVRVCTKFLTSKTICKPEKPAAGMVSQKFILYLALGTRCGIP